MSQSILEIIERPASPPSAPLMGSGFVACSCGYEYEWIVTSEVVAGPGGPFVWAKPVRRIKNSPAKRGRLRLDQVWYLAHIPNTELSHGHTTTKKDTI